MKTLLIAALFLLNDAAAQKQLCIIELKNPLNLDRKETIIEIPFSALRKKLGKASLQKLFIKDNQNTELAYQWITDGKKTPQYLLIQTDIPAQQTIILRVQVGKSLQYKAKTFGRYVPERFDDFAWENDKIAFRMYGPALQNRDDNAFGIDVWSKRTNELVINKWYKKDYHKDDGEGLDYYKVGFTLGAGDIAPYINDSIFFSRNYATHKVLDNGPLRTCFQLGYKAWNAGRYKIEATKKITLDAGSQMNKIEVLYKITGADSLSVVTGIAKRPAAGVVHLDEKEGIMAYWEPQEVPSGTMGIACILPGMTNTMLTSRTHVLTNSYIYNNRPFTYYTGAAWDKAGIIQSSEDWVKYLYMFKTQLSTPLTITIK